MYRGSGEFKIPGKDFGPVRKLLAGGPSECWEGTPSLESAGETTEEGGGGATSVHNVLPGGGPGSIIFWAKTWVLSEAMSRNTEGVHVGFLSQITG